MKKWTWLFFLICLLILSHPLSAITSNYSSGNTIIFQDSLSADSSLITGEDYNAQNQAEGSVANNVVLTDITPSFNFISLLRGIFGLAVLIFIAYLFSNNRKAISWKVVLTGLAVQLLLAIAILQIPFVQDFFEIRATVPPKEA